MNSTRKENSLADNHTNKSAKPIRKDYAVCCCECCNNTLFERRQQSKVQRVYRGSTDRLHAQRTALLNNESENMESTQLAAWERGLWLERVEIPPKWTQCKIEFCWWNPILKRLKIHLKKIAICHPKKGPQRTTQRPLVAIHIVNFTSWGLDSKLWKQKRKAAENDLRKIIISRRFSRDFGWWIRWWISPLAETLYLARESD